MMKDTVKTKMRIKKNARMIMKKKRMTRKILLAKMKTMMRSMTKKEILLDK